MSTQTTYKCDRCGAECDENDAGKKDGKQFWSIGIALHYGVGYSDSRSMDVRVRKDWCRTCVAEYGLLPTDDQGQKVAPTPDTTIEDLIREIIRDEMEAQ